MCRTLARWVLCPLLLAAAGGLLPRAGQAAERQEADSLAARAQEIRARITALRERAADLKAAGRMDEARQAHARAEAMEAEFEQWPRTTRMELQVQELRRKAEQLEAKGSTADAAELREKARRLMEAGSKAPGHRAVGPKDERHLVGRIEHAIVALRALGGQEELIEELLDAARGLVERAEKPADHSQPARTDLFGPGARFKAVKEQELRPTQARPLPRGDLALLRAAVTQLAKAGRRDAAHRVELGELWRKLQAQRAPTAKVVAARKVAPTPAELARHLRLAARLCQRDGAGDLAKALVDFAGRLAPDARPSPRDAAAPEEAQRHLEQLSAMAEETRARREVLEKQLEAVKAAHARLKESKARGQRAEEELEDLQAENARLKQQLDALRAAAEKKQRDRVAPSR